VPGGSGDTVLALEVARGLTAEFCDGIWLVELASLVDSALVAQAVASPLGVRESPERPLLDGLVKYLVIDNCEHLIDACAQLAGHLLERCPTLHILATGRKPLRIPVKTIPYW
jgi:predicted ATPase